MSTQVAVRLPDETVAFIDAEIAAGRAKSRAALVARAVAREQRRRLAERDARILAGVDGDPYDFDGLADVARRVVLDVD